MAVQMDTAALKIISGSYGNLFTSEKENSAKQKSKSQSRTVNKQTLQAIHKQVFIGGVHTPLLTDYKPGPRHLSCKMDLLDNYTRYNMKDRKHFSAYTSAIPKLEKERTNLSLKTTGCTPRVFRFLLPNGSVKDSEDYTPDESEIDEWEKWKSSVANAKDARDVLYRNTFCGGRKVRYNSLTLPRIAIERGWTLVDLSPKNRKNLVLENADDISQPATIVPQPSRSHCLSSQNQRKPNPTHQHKYTDSTFFEVRRIKANTDLLKGTVGQYTTHVRQPTETAHNVYTVPYQTRYDRPLKHEGGRYLPMSRRAQTYSVQIPTAPRPGSRRDYKSAEAYKQYLETAQTIGMEVKKTGNTRSNEKDNSEISHYGYENRVLQSVIDVNQPPKAETPQLPEKLPLEDPSLNSDENAMPTNRSNTNKSSKSIVIEIKPTWREKEDLHKDKDNGKKDSVDKEDDDKKAEIDKKDESDKNPDGSTVEQEVKDT